MGCGASGSNPSTPCNKQEGLRKKYFLVKNTFKFATNTEAETLANWQTAIQNKDIIPLPAVIGREPANEGAVYEQTPYGSIHVRDGRMEEKIIIMANSDLASKIRGLKSAGEYGLFYAYDSGIIKGYKPEGTDNFAPFTLQFVNPEYKTENDGSVGSKIPIHISFEDPTEHEDFPTLINPAWNPNSLKSLDDVSLTVVSSVATKIVFTATKKHILSNVEKLNPVLGLVVTDVLLLTTAGVSQTVATLTYDAVLGQYSANGTGLVTGTINLKSPSLMTTKGYESKGAAAVTI